MNTNTQKFFHLKRIIIGMVGVVIYSFGMNFFAVPMQLYSGGIYGMCQLGRTFAVEALGFHFGSLDIAGIFNYIVNIPLIFLAYKIMPKTFVVKLIIMVTAMSAILALFPVPKEPIIDEMLTNCLIGGILCGFGIGTYLRAGYSAGGTEIIGIYYIRKNPNFSIGRINIVINFVVYSICMFFFDISTVIYSVIFSVVSSLIMDKVHLQNVNVEAIIISRENNDMIEQQVLKDLNRGITYWDAYGGYTGEKLSVMYTILSKYEVPTLRHIVYSCNPGAFMVVKEGLTVNGNYIKRL